MKTTNDILRETDDLKNYLRDWIELYQNFCLDSNSLKGMSDRRIFKTHFTYEKWLKACDFQTGYGKKKQLK